MASSPSVLLVTSAARMASVSSCRPWRVRSIPTMMRSSPFAVTGRDADTGDLHKYAACFRSGTRCRSSERPAHRPYDPVPSMAPAGARDELRSADVLVHLRLSTSTLGAKPCICLRHARSGGGEG